MSRKIAIIGAGLTGLSLAHHLKKYNIDFTIFERADRVGGAICTEQKDGFMFETGPSTGLMGTPEMAELLEELACELDYADEAAKARWVWKYNDWHNLPSGVISGIATPLFSLKDKFRLLAEPFIKRGKNPNESLANLVRRRMGKSFLNYAVDPFVLGIYAGDPEQLVTKYALPKLHNLEQDYGSFIGGSLKKKRREIKSERDLLATRETFSLRNGLSDLINALEKELTGHIVLNAKNLKVEREDKNYIVSHDTAEQSTAYGTVISTIGGWAIEDTFNFLPKAKLAAINKLQYAKVTQVSVGFNNWKGRDINAFGGLVPFCEERQILGALFLSSFLKHRCPEGGALFSVFLGGLRKPELVEKTDQEVNLIVQQEFMDMFGLEDWQPDLFEIRRHTHAIPQYGIESEEKLAAISAIEDEFPGLYLAGNLRDGISMSDRVSQAYQIAQQVTQTTPTDSTGLRTHM